MNSDAKRKTVVISGISIFDGGALTILNLVANHLSDKYYNSYQVIFILHDRKLLPSSLPAHIEVLELNKKRVSWTKRLYYEYFYFYFLSKKLKPYLWLSLHELTPIVQAEKRAVYCHNAHIFSNHSLRMILFEPTIWLFKNVFFFLNKLSIKKNDYVIIQQTWMRTLFQEKFNLAPEQLIVSRPNSRISEIEPKPILTGKNKIIKFIYPVVPRSSKNFEVICEAVKILENKSICNFEILFTFKGDENRYAKHIKNEYGFLKSLKFIGGQTHKEVFELYAKSDYLIFSSLFESWGLPISEFKSFDKPMILPDLPYAKSALGDYDKVLFFDPLKDDSLLSVLESILLQDDFSDFENNVFSAPKKPFASSWKELFDIILKF